MQQITIERARHKGTVILKVEGGLGFVRGDIFYASTIDGKKHQIPLHAIDYITIETIDIEEGAE